MTAALIVARTYEELESLRSAWQSLPWTRTDPDIDFYSAVMKNRDEVIRPHAILVEENGRATAGIAGRIEHISLATRFGYRTVFNPRVRSLTIALGGSVVADAESTQIALMRDALLDVLARHEADVLWLPGLRTDSPLQSALLQAVGPLRRQLFLEPNVHHLLILPPTFSEFVASRSRTVRKNIKYYKNKLERTFGDQLSLEILRDPADLERIVGDLTSVAAKTYQHRLGVSFTDSPEQRAILELALSQDWFRAFILYRDGIPVAFWTGYLYRGVFFVGTPGYDTSLADYSVGTYLLCRVIEHLCSDPTAFKLDFGSGDAPYKRQFGTDSWVERDVMIFASTPRNVLINGVRGIILASNSAAKRILAATSTTQRVKTLWRQRLSTKHHAASGKPDGS